MALVRGPRIVRNGLVLHLDAAQSTSYSGLANPWKDLSSNSRNGTFTNGPSYNSSNGGSIVFDGTNDYVSIANSTGLQFTNSQAYTISSWVYWIQTNYNHISLSCTLVIDIKIYQCCVIKCVTIFITF